MKKSIIAVAFALVLSPLMALDMIWDNNPGKLCENNKPGSPWEKTWYPIGNGELGAMLDGRPRFRVQFNVDNFWTGDKNLTDDIDDSRADKNYSTMGAYQNFGQLELPIKEIDGKSFDYKHRLIDLSSGVYEDKFSSNGIDIHRLAFASAVDKTIAIQIRASKPITVEPIIFGAHGEKPGVEISGVLPNKLAYAAEVISLMSPDKKTWTFYLHAETSFDSSVHHLGLGDKVKPFKPIPRTFEQAFENHIAEYRSLYDRCHLTLKRAEYIQLPNGKMVRDLDKTSSLPLPQRLQRCRRGARDVELEALLFNFGRYLMISSSRKGTLPANLQGIWNNSNNPPWHSDYHTNINLQMMYWGEDPTNLSECFDPLADWMFFSLPWAEEGTRAAFPNSKGYAYRTSANAFGGGGWRWNYAGAPWLAIMVYDHYLYTLDKEYLKNKAWPLMKGAAEFMFSHFKEREDGTIVVKDGWSPEHHWLPRQDGIAHDQQIVRELYLDVIEAAEILGIDDDFVKEVKRISPKLLKDKIGKWGQLQEWEQDLDKEVSDHRHTSQLFAVYPGKTINLHTTPRLAKAAVNALFRRLNIGDAIRSWTWPWRAALWARLGHPEMAGYMISSLLEHSINDNFFANHPPFQLDGNYGATAAIAEMLMQSHERTEDGKVIIRILPGVPAAWDRGNVVGLKARGGYTVDIEWNKNKLNYKVNGGDPNGYVIKLKD